MPHSRGNDRWNAKLTPELVKEIRVNRKGKSDRQWARELNMHPNAIANARRGLSWGWVI